MPTTLTIHDLITRRVEGEEPGYLLNSLLSEDFEEQNYEFVDVEDDPAEKEIDEEDE